MFMLSAFLIFCFLKHTEFCKCLGYMLLSHCILPSIMSG